MKNSQKLTLICSSLFLAQTSFAQNVLLKVDSKPSQLVKGFGCSLPPKNLTNAIPPDMLSTLFQGSFQTLRMDVLRLWAEINPSLTMDQVKNNFVNNYVHSKTIEQAVKNGVTTLLLAPSYGKKGPNDSMKEHATRIAELIHFLRMEHKVKIAVSGVVNEPGATFAPADLVELVRSFRGELDKRNLKDVSIIAPESANADRHGMDLILGMKGDPAAWNATAGIATHSYNMAATRAFAATIAGTKKDYWQTEAGFNGHEDPNDDKRAADISARFLNDINSGVNYWIYFLCFSKSENVATAPDNATQIQTYDVATKSVVSFLKHSYLKQLRGTFPNSSVMYPVIGTEDVRLTYTYAPKSKLNAAAAMRPDKKWALAVVNNSGPNPMSQGDWPKAETTTVSFQLPPPLANRNLISFRVWRSSGTAQLKEETPISPRNGVLTVTLEPKELVSIIEK